MRSAVCIASVLLCACLFAARAQAAIEAGIGLHLEGADIFTSGTKIVWTRDPSIADSITGSLSVTGKSSTMDIDANDFPNYKISGSGNNFAINIRVRIDPDSETITLLDGAVKITGELRPFPNGNALAGTTPSSVLLQGEVVGFGLWSQSSTTQGGQSSSSATFEFVFQPTGGVLHITEPYVFFPRISGSIVSLSNTGTALNPFALSSFASNFAISGATGNDTGSMVVPEPSALPIFLGLAVALLAPRFLRRGLAGQS